MSMKFRFEMHAVAIAATALVAAHGTASAQQNDEVRELTSPDNTSVSAGVLIGSKGRSSQYNGVTTDLVMELEFEKTRRDEASGTWENWSGRNLGMDNRELSFSRQRQGDWMYSVDYNEIVRLDPYVIHTGMTGIGGTNPGVNLIKLPSMPAAWVNANGAGAGALTGSALEGHDEQLKLKRTALGFAGAMSISSALQLEVNLREERKTGARMFGRVGIDSSDMSLRPNNVGKSPNGGWALLLTPEPIDSLIRTFEARLNYNRDRLALSAGYYGSVYINNNQNLSPSVPSSLNRGALWTNCAIAGCSTIQQLASSAVALPPDNQAHQMYMSGVYRLSDVTSANLKVSLTHATQDEDYGSMGLTPATGAPASLRGVSDTGLAQVGLTTRPIKDLSLNASLRYEDRDDKTPVFVYNTNGGSGTNNLNNSNNWPSGSQKRTTAKVDSVYRLPAGYSLNGGLEWERKVTPLPPNGTHIFANQIAFRDALEETALKLGLRKALSETLNGSVGAEMRRRRGNSDGWYTGSSTGTGAALVKVNESTSNTVLADMYMDRDRTKASGTLDWEASDKLSLQLAAEHAQDDYLRTYTNVPTNLIQTVPGARKVINDAVTLDASYKLTNDWSVTGFWTRSESRWNVNKANLGDDTFNTTDTTGLTVKGRLSTRVTAGMDILMSTDVTRFNNVVATAATGNIAGFGATPGNYLPNITYLNNKVNLFANYEVDKKSSVRTNVQMVDFRTDDWQWGYNGIPFLYSDNTTVSNPNQYSTMLSVVYTRRF